MKKLRTTFSNILTKFCCNLSSFYTCIQLDDSALSYSVIASDF